jgi:hypothetical protein
MRHVGHPRLRSMPEFSIDVVCLDARLVDGRFSSSPSMGVAPDTDKGEQGDERDGRQPSERQSRFAESARTR